MDLLRLFNVSFVCLLAAFVLGGCAQTPVTIIKLPLDLEERVHQLDREEHQAMKEDGLTKWFFHCSTQFQLEENQEQIADGVRLKITVKTVKVTLSLPCIVWLSPGCNPKVKEHEQGHVEICRRVYEKARAVAERAAQPLIGQSYVEEGRRYMVAKQRAVNDAAQQFCSQYLKEISPIADEVSQNYDDLTEHGRNLKAPKVAVDEAFERYYRSHRQ